MWAANLIKKILISFGGFFLVSCVGVVQDMNPAETKGAIANEAVLQFDGIVKVIPISDTKIEIYFYTIKSGVSSDFTYDITYDGISDPISVTGDTLSTDWLGLSSYTIKNLLPDTFYNVKVEARNIQGVSSHNDNIVSTKTFKFPTADFRGISNLSNVSGVDGITSLSVSWLPAKKFLPDGTHERDPFQYEIVLLKDDELQPNSFDKTDYSRPERIVEYTESSKTSIIIKGLEENARYTARVRCIHNGFTDSGNEENPLYKREQNNKYLEARTLSSTNITINYSSFKNILKSSKTLTFSWEKGLGAFDHYRIYYTTLDNPTSWDSLVNQTTNNEIFGQPCETTPSDFDCKFISNDLTQIEITDLKPYTEYSVHLVLCPDSDCNLLTGQNPFIFTSQASYETQAKFAAFNGITGVSGARYASSLDSAYLQFTPPSVSTGDSDGILIQIKSRSESDNKPPSDTYLNHPLALNTTDFSFVNFDYLKDNEIELKGFSITSFEEYCFSLYSYVWNGDGSDIQINTATSNQKCIVMRPILPQNFLGINTTTSTTIDGPPRYASLLWSLPTLGDGVYDKFIIFLADEDSLSSGFDFSSAIADTNQTTYLRFEVDANTSNFQTPTLPSGKNFSIGVLPYLSTSKEFSNGNLGIYSTSGVGP